MKKGQIAKLTEHIFTIGKFMKGEMGFDSKTTHLTLIQLQVLLLLRDKELMMQEVAQYCSVTKPTSTVFLNNLVKLGLVKRVGDSMDRRVVKVSLTKKGRQIVQQARLYREEKLQKLLSFVTEEDQRDLLRILEGISKKLSTK